MQTSTTSVPPCSIDQSDWRNGIYCLELQQPWSHLLQNGTKRIETRDYALPEQLLNRRIYILQSPAGKSKQSSVGNSKIPVGVLFSSPKQDNTKPRKYSYDDDSDDSNTNQSCKDLLITGWCIFNKVKVYTSEHDFLTDGSYHLVTKDSDYNPWRNSATSDTRSQNNNFSNNFRLYGWVVSNVGFVDKNNNELQGLLSYQQPNHNDSQTSATTLTRTVVFVQRRLRSIFQFMKNDVLTGSQHCVGDKRM